MFEIQTNRIVKKRFRDRVEYLESLVAVDVNADHLKACVALAAVNPLAPSQSNPWRGLPWITPILGSGCLDMADDPRFEPERWTEAVDKAVEMVLAQAKSSHVDSNYFDAKSTAVHFAKGLLRDRVTPRERGGRTGSGEPGPLLDQGASGGWTVAPIAAQATIFASLLTRLFFAACAAGDPEPLSRWDDDHAVIPLEVGRDGLDGNAPHRIDELKGLVVRHGDLLIESLDINPELTKGMTNAIKTLVADILGSITHRTTPRVSMADLRIITEVSWYLLVDGLPEYPGWTDLLFGLVLRDKTKRIDLARPTFTDLREAQSPLHELLEGPTKASWTSWSQPSEVGNADRKAFYLAVADVLWAQQTTISGPDGSGCPPASAFVTSFDLELEMALLRRAALDTQFFVVVPVHVFEADDGRAKPCWLRATITKTESWEDQGLDAILRPVEWQLMSSATEPKDLRAGPHVVRLNGSPMMGLPSPGAVSEQLLNALAVAGIGYEGVGSIEHALTLDEHLAVQQAEVELLFAALDRPDAATRGQNRSLPRLLFASSAVRNETGECPRFWMAFGVPVGDSAVRHRLVSQITRSVDPGPSASSGMSSPGSPAHQDPTDGLFGSTVSGAAMPDADQSGSTDLDGVIVNRRVGVAEAQLLTWVGFDVVQDRATAFTQDLIHYTQHLVAGPDCWPRPNTRNQWCGLPE